MAKTGIDLPIIQGTGIDKEHVKVQLDYHKETNKQNLAFKEKCVDNVFSANFLVFIVIIMIIASGLIYMTVDGVTKTDILDYWKLIIPAITTYIGYAIGKGKSV